MSAIRRNLQLTPMRTSELVPSGSLKRNNKVWLSLSLVYTPTCNGEAIACLKETNLSCSGLNGVALAITMQRARAFFPTQNFMETWGAMSTFPR